MMQDEKPADEVLHCGQAVHVSAEGSRWDYDGTLEEMQGHVLALRLEANPMDYALSPDAGTPVSCTIADDGCAYRFQSGFRSSSKLPDTIWYLEMPETVARVQQRAYVRVPLALPMQVKLAGAHGSHHNFHDTMLVDLSGGGLCFVSNHAAPVPSVIRVRIPDLPGIGTLDADAVVIHCSAIETPGERPCWHIGASLVLRHHQQNALVQCVCDLQRTYLQRGLRIPNMAHQKQANA